MIFYIIPSIFNFRPNTHNYHRLHRLLVVVVVVVVVVAHPPPYSLDVVDSVVSMTQSYSTIAIVVIDHQHYRYQWGTAAMRDEVMGDNRCGIVSAGTTCCCCG